MSMIRTHVLKAIRRGCVKRGLALLATAVVFAGTAGCAIVSSSRLAPGQTDAQGVVYALPMARVPLTLSAYQGQISVTIGEPVIVRDPDRVYALRRVPNPFSSDAVTIDVDPATGFLTSIKATSADQSLALLEKLLLQGSGVPEGKQDEAEVLYRSELDPTNATELQAAAGQMTNALQAFLSAKAAGACESSDNACTQYKALANTPVQIGLTGSSVQVTASPENAADKSAEPDCSVGICYRQLQPYTLTASVANRQQTVVVNIPNAAPVLALPIERHAFVITTHTLTFEQGTLRTATISRPSSALAFISSPLAAASGVLRSLADAISTVLKIDTSGQYQAKAIESAADAKAQAEAVATKVTAERSAGKPLAAIHLGQRSGGGIAGLKVGAQTTKGNGPTPAVTLLQGSNGSGN